MYILALITILAIILIQIKIYLFFIITVNYIDLFILALLF